MPRMESHRKRSNKDSNKSNTPLRNLPNHINRRVACRCTNCNVPFSQMSWEKNARQEQISASGGMAPWGLHQAGCFSLHHLRIYMVSLNPHAKLQADSHRFDGQTGFNHRNFHPSFIFLLVEHAFPDNLPFSQALRVLPCWWLCGFSHLQCSWTGHFLSQDWKHGKTIHLKVVDMMTLRGWWILRALVNVIFFMKKH